MVGHWANLQGDDNIVQSNGTVFLKIAAAKNTVLRYFLDPTLFQANSYYRLVFDAFPSDEHVSNKSLLVQIRSTINNGDLKDWLSGPGCASKECYDHSRNLAKLNLDEPWSNRYSRVIHIPDNYDEYLPLGVIIITFMCRKENVVIEDKGWYIDNVHISKFEPLLYGILPTPYEIDHGIDRPLTPGHFRTTTSSDKTDVIHYLDESNNNNYITSEVAIYSEQYSHGYTLYMMLTTLTQDTMYDLTFKVRNTMDEYVRLYIDVRDRFNNRFRDDYGSSLDILKTTIPSISYTFNSSVYDELLINIMLYPRHETSGFVYFNDFLLTTSQRKKTGLRSH